MAPSMNISLSFELEKMEASPEQCNQAEIDEEYVLLDLENICMEADIPANAPYTLSGLDTLNPTLTIGNRLKLIGEYEETIGTCIIFRERVVKKNETAGSYGGNNLPKDEQHAKGNKQFRHVTSLHKVLKFRLEADGPTENFL